MKRNFVFFAFLMVFTLGFFGCVEPGEEIVKQPRIKEWITGLEEINIERGKQEFDFSFEPTVPPAASYTLYYIEGIFSEEDVDQIIEDGEYVAVDRQLRAGKVSELESNTTYSVVVAARSPGYKDSISVVKHVSISYNHWVKELIDFEIELGNIGEVTYSFNETEPVADIYTLYYAEGKHSTLDDVKDAHDVKSIEVTELSGTISDIKGKRNYTFVVVAEYEDLIDIDSGVKTITTNYKWITEISDFSVTLNDNDPTEVYYSFKETSPAAEEYTIYYVAGNKTTPSEIINDSNKQKFDNADLSEVIPGLLLKKNYSFVIVARHSEIEGDSVSGVINNIYTEYTKWIKNIHDLRIRNTNDFGYLRYSFSHTIPQADEYVIYYREGKYEDASEIKKGYNSVIESDSGTIQVSDYMEDTNYSFIIAAKYGNLPESVSNEFVFNSTLNLITDVNAQCEIRYSFDEIFTAPNNYHLYCYYGETSDINEIKNGSTPIKVNPSETMTRIPGKKKGGIYSLIIVAEYDNEIDNKTSNVVKVSVEWVTTSIHFSPVYNAAEMEMTYSFSHTNPEADSYYIYYLHGESVHHNEVRNNSNSVPVPVTPTQTGKLELPSGINSVILAAHYDGLDDLISEAHTIDTMGKVDDVIAQINALPVISQRSHIALVEAARRAFSDLGKSQQFVNEETINKLIAAENRILELEKFVLTASLDRTKDIDRFTNNTFESSTEFGLNVSLKNGFGENKPLTFEVSAEYSFKGLNVDDGKLTNEVFDLSTPVPVAAVGDLYRFDFGSKLGQATGKFIVKNSGDTVEVPFATLDIERRLYNIAEARAKDFGAVEMFSHGKAASYATVVSGNVFARGHTIVNYDKNGNGLTSYSMTVSNTTMSGILGGNAATQIRESYYDGEYLYGRSRGGSTGHVSTQTGDSSTILPVASGWDGINSVDSGHRSKWTIFVNRFKQNPFGYIPYDIQSGFTGYHQYQYPNSSSATNGSGGASLTGGRQDSPAGISDLNPVSGRLAYDTANGTFQFTFSMNGTNTNNKVGIEWAGNVDVATYPNSLITFVIDADMKFVKYHAVDRYTVSLMSASTNTYATMYFIYHKNNVNYEGHKIYRGHQLRENYNNVCECNGTCEAHVTDGENAVINGSGYAINLVWTANTSAESKIAIP